MATPAFRAAGTAVFSANNVANPTALTPTKSGSTINGDLMLCVTECRSITATVSTPTGWTLLTGFPIRSGTASGGSVYVFSRIADGTADDAPTITWTGVTTGTNGDSCGARIHSWQNAVAIQAGTVTSTDAASTTTVTMPAITTTFGNALIVGIVVKINDTVHTWSVATRTERSDDHTTTGTGHGTVVSDLVQTGVGASGTAVATPSTTVSSRTLAISIAMKPVIVTATVGQATETDTARRLAVPFGRVIETDTAQAITGRRTRAIGQASETDTAQPSGGLGTVALSTLADTFRTSISRPPWFADDGITWDATGAVDVSATAGSGVSRELRTVRGNYSIDGSYVFGEFPEHTVGSNLDELTVSMDASDTRDKVYVRNDTEVGTLIFGEQLDASAPATSLTFSSVDHRWWAIVHRLTGGLGTFDWLTAAAPTGPPPTDGSASANGWTRRRQAARTNPLSTAQQLQIGCRSQGGVASSGRFVVDNINTVAVAVSRATETDTARRLAVPFGRATDTETAGALTAPLAYDVAVDLGSPISHWKLGDASSPAVDRKVVSDAAAVGGPTFGVSRLARGGDGAIAFSGGARLSAPYQAAHNILTYVLEAWINLDSYPASGHYYVCGRNLRCALMVTNTGVLRGLVNGGTAIAATTPLLRGRTYHVVLKHDGAGTIRYYIDGVLDREVTGQNNPTTDTTSKFQIGRDDGGAFNGFEGRIDEVALYSTLSDARIAANYTAGAPPMQTVAIGQATNTQTSRPLTRVKTKAIGQAIDTQTAAILTPVQTTNGQTIAVGQATETDMAGTITARKTLAIAQTSDTETAGATGRLKTLAIAQASDTETARTMVVVDPILRVIAQASDTETAGALTHSKTRAIAQASDIETARTMVIVDPILRVIGQASDTETAGATGRLKTKAVAQSSDTETAGAITSLKLKAVAQALDTETAGATTARKTKTIGQASDSETAGATTSTKVVTTGQASDTEAARTITRRPIVARSTESDTAAAIAHNGTLAIGEPSETDTATALARLKVTSIGRATETDVAQAVALVRGATVGQVTDLQVARALDHSKVLAIGRASELDVALAVTVEGAGVVSVEMAIETGTAGALGHSKVQGLGIATDLETALALVAQKVLAIAAAAEADSAGAITSEHIATIGQAAESDEAAGLLVIQTTPAIGQAVETSTAGALILVLPDSEEEEDDVVLFSITPDMSGFEEAQERLRSMMGVDISFYWPTVTEWPADTPLNPETGRPFDPTVLPAASGYASASVRCSIVHRPIRGNVEDQTENNALARMDAKNVGLIMNFGAFPSAATEFEWLDRRYKIVDHLSDALSTARRDLAFGEMM